MLKYIIGDDRLGLADYKNPSNQHITESCWPKQSGKSALLILKNIQVRERRYKVIEKQYRLYNLLKTGDVNLLQFVWDQLKSNPKLKEKWLAEQDTLQNGKWYAFYS